MPQSFSKSIDSIALTNYIILCIENRNISAVHIFVPCVNLFRIYFGGNFEEKKSKYTVR